jgi:hypothetical protein
MIGRRSYWPWPLCDRLFQGLKEKVGQAPCCCSCCHKAWRRLQEHGIALDQCEPCEALWEIFQFRIFPCNGGLGLSAPVDRNLPIPL